MKLKTFFVCMLILFSAFFCGCKTENHLVNYVSELRTDVFKGESENYRVVANYGYKETPFIADGTAKNKTYRLSFKLLDKETSEATFELSFSHGGKDYSSTFNFDPVSHSLLASVELDDFALKEFSICIANASNSETILMQSLLPKNTISFTSALDHVAKKQSKLIENYTDQNGNFTAEIHLRVLVKEQTAYWFVGIVKDGNMKAFLVDGISGEILAMKEIL